MTKWEVKKLSEVCSGVMYGYTESASKENIGPKFLRITDIVPEHINWGTVPYCKISDSQLKKYKLYEGDIVIARTGATTGFNKMISKDMNAVFASYLIRFRVNQEQYSAKFISYCLKTTAYKGFIDNYISGAAQPGINATVLSKFRFSTPDLSTQKRIADILSAYDDLIENNNRRIAILEKSAQELYKEWFVRLRFPNYENTKFVNGLPEGWEVVRLGKAFDTSSGGTPSRKNELYYINGVYDWIKTGELNDRFILSTSEKITEEAIKKSAAKLIPADSLILAMYGATIGKMGITTKESTCNQACCVFSEKDYLSKEFLYLWLLFNREFIISIGFGAAQQNLSQESIKRIKILKPSQEIMIKFDDKICNGMKKIKSLMLINANLAKQRDLLLPRLLSGKLEV